MNWSGILDATEDKFSKAHSIYLCIPKIRSEPSDEEVHPIAAET